MNSFWNPWQLFYQVCLKYFKSLLALCQRRYLRHPAWHYHGRCKSLTEKQKQTYRNAPKPEWVKQEIIRMKAQMPIWVIGPCPISLIVVTT